MSSFAQDWSVTSINNACYIPTGLGKTGYEKQIFVRPNQELLFDFGTFDLFTYLQIKSSGNVLYTRTTPPNPLFTGIIVIPPIFGSLTGSFAQIEIKYGLENGETYTIPFDLTLVSNHDEHYYKLGGERMLVWFGRNQSKLTKPFVIIEGFDPSNVNNENLYYNASNSGLIEYLRQIGYDIVIYQFADGGGSLSANSAHVQSALKFLKNRLLQNNSNQKITLAGISMGGLIARHALIKLEQESITNIVDIFISMDSPQKGAVMPVDFMSYIKLNDSENISLNSVAAKQMLRNNPFNLTNEYAKFFTFFDNKNMPTSTYNLGVAFSSNQQRVISDNIWLSVLTNAKYTALHPFIDLTYDFSGKDFYVSNATEAFIPGSKLPLNKTNTYGNVNHEILSVVNKFIFPIGTIADKFITKTYTSPTFIPFESALNIDNNGNSRFDLTISSNSHSYHDIIPDDIIPKLIEIISNGYVVLIDQNTTFNSSQLISGKKYIIKNNVALTLNGSMEILENHFLLGLQSKLIFQNGTFNLNNSSIHCESENQIDFKSTSNIFVPGSRTLILSGKPSFMGNGLQIDQGGELEIKDGTEATFSDSFQFYNYGTLRVGEGVTMNLKNLNNYTSSNTLINTGNGARTTFNISSGGVVYVNGLATVKGTTFKKKTTSNFSRVDLSGSAVRAFENVQIEGSQYGFHVSNVPSGKVSFKNVTGNGNFYSTIKATNSSITLDGMITTNSSQDGLSAYSSSFVSLKGNQSYSSSLIGIRSAQYAWVETLVPGAIQITDNTRGVHVYTNGQVHLTGTSNELATIWLNLRTDNVYGGVVPYDLYAVLDGEIHINYYNNWTMNEYEDEANLITKLNGVPSNGGFVSHSGVKESLESAIPSKKDILRAYRAFKKEKNKSAIQQLLAENKEHSQREVRSMIMVLSILDATLEQDFAWISNYDKKARLMPLLKDDAKLVAEQLFYFYTITQPNEQEAAYWKGAVTDLYPEMAETGIFESIYESASFNQESVSEPEAEMVQEKEHDSSVQVSPNPFNPTTRLQFSLNTNAQVTIQVYDIMGRMVKTLANKTYEQGNHIVTFDASALASGMYFARTTIVANGKSPVVQTSKMMLVK